MSSEEEEGTPLGVIKRQLHEINTTTTTTTTSSIKANITTVNESNDNSECLTLEKCIEAFTAVESLEEGEEVWCGRCQSSQPAQRQMSLNELPETLVLYLKRFHFHSGRSYKLHNPVACPKILRIPPASTTSSLVINSSNTNTTAHNLTSKPHCTPTDAAMDTSCEGQKGGAEGGTGNREFTTYQLQSYVCHIGESVNSGHYTACARNALSGQWYYFNDESVTPQDSDPSSHSNENIYILFYQRVDCSYNIRVDSIPPPPPPAATTVPHPPTKPALVRLETRPLPYDDCLFGDNKGVRSRDTESLPDSDLCFIGGERYHPGHKAQTNSSEESGAESIPANWKVTESGAVMLCDPTDPPKGRRRNNSS